MPNEILMSFVGMQDPYSHKGGGGNPGPILTLVKDRAFSKVFLLHMPDSESVNRARNTASALVSLSTSARPSTVPLAIDDPSNHEQLMAALRTWWNALPKEPDAEYFISVSSGTSAMHAAWLLLSAADEIHANILYTRDPRHVTEGQPLVCEINPRSPVFPQILPRISLAEVAQPAARQQSEPLAGEQYDLAKNLIGKSAAFRTSVDLALKFAATDHSVLISGETGTGKERFARLIHKGSKRAHGPFVAMNCAAVPANLIESILFGHVKGAFTGADRDKEGFFEEAHGGTLFLDEIGDMPLEMQAKLLRVLQERRIRRVGGTGDVLIDVRIVAATHVDLLKSIRNGRFREDLFRRISILPINLPPLRQRRDDIPDIAQAILDSENSSCSIQKSFSSKALEKLLAYSWPGNIRELESVVILGHVISDGQVIDAQHLEFFPSSSRDEMALPVFTAGFSVTEFLNKYRYRIYTEALRQAGDNQSRAGRLLGCTSTAIMKFLKEHEDTFGKENHETS